MSIRPPVSPRISEAPPPVRPTRLPSGFSAFGHRNYRLFFSGQLISVTGTWMQSLAQAWLVLTLTSSALLFSLVTVLQFAPILVLGVVAGVLADRFSKRTILVLTQIASSALATILTVLVITKRVELWHVYALALALGVVNAFDMPTRQSFVVDMVGREDLMNAIALNSSLFNVARIIGPTIAGLILATKGAAWCFGLNAVSYLAVIAGLMMMRDVPRGLARKGSGISQIKEGLAYVGGSRPLLMPIVLVAVIAISGMNFQVWIPLLARREFQVGAGGFGLLMASLGLGSLAGALYLAFSKGGPRASVMLVAAALLGVALLIVAVAAALPVHVMFALMLLPLMGFGMSTASAMANTIVQTISPEEMRGRVMSVYMTFFAGTGPLGSFLAGALSSAFGTPASMAIGGVVTLGATAFIAYWFGAIGSRATASRNRTRTDQATPAATHSGRD